MRIQDLAAQSVLTRSGMSRAVERLERAGLVQRTEAQEDKRGAYAALTASGLTRLRSALRAHVALVRRAFLSHYSQAELEHLATLWRRAEEVG